MDGWMVDGANAGVCWVGLIAAISNTTISRRTLSQVACIAAPMAVTGNR